MIKTEKPVIAGAGELLWDLLPTGKQLGGAPCNFAYHAVQAGCEGFVISAAGHDDNGAELLDRVRNLGLSDRYIQVVDYPTGTVSIRLNAAGHPDYTIHEQVAWDHFTWNDAIRELAGRLDAVCFGSLAQREPDSRGCIAQILKSVRPECLKIFDINLRQHYFSKEVITDSLRISDVIKLNDDELPVVAGYLELIGSLEDQISQLLVKMNLRYVVYTMGDKGSIIATPKEISFVEAPRVTVADTVGAGDAFTAVFAAGILLGYSLRDVHKKASDVAAWVCTQKGATPKYSKKIF
jgi:fructokinase